MKRISIRITGIVQGVFYRANTEKTANAIGVTGFVRNETDGSVYIEAQGSEKQLQQLTDWCGRGPERAVVTKVVTENIAVVEEQGFVIRR